jgi:hypothetical protein
MAQDDTIQNIIERIESARDIEEYFNQRASIGVAKTKGPRVPNDDSIDDSSDDS